MTWRNAVCMMTGRALCPDVNTLVSPLNGPSKSPIDDFYASTSATLTRIDPNFLTTYGEDIAGLLFVGLISSTENYFRDILGFILGVCPIAQSHSSDEKIQLGSLLWAEDQLQNRAAFEFLPFSSAENVRKAVTKFCKHTIKSKGTFDLMLEEYDKLCELRHAVVHSAHIVAGKNALKLNLRRSSQALKVRIRYPDLQASGSVCTALVQAANNELFEAMVTRWGRDWRNLPSWEPSKEGVLLNRLYAGFLSVRDQQNNSISNGLTKRSLKNRIKTEFNL